VRARKRVLNKTLRRRRRLRQRKLQQLYKSNSMPTSIRSKKKKINKLVSFLSQIRSIKNI
jgi:hypothetical protein